LNIAIEIVDLPTKNGGSFQFVFCKRFPGRVPPNELPPVQHGSTIDQAAFGGQSTLRAAPGEPSVPGMAGSFFGIRKIWGKES